MSMVLMMSMMTMTIMTVNEAPVGSSAGTVCYKPDGLPLPRS